VQNLGGRAAATARPAGVTARAAVIGLALALSLAACKLGPNFASPKSPATQHYASNGERLPGEPSAEAEGAPPQRVAFGAKVAADWWHLFHSPPLDAVVKQALADSPTIAEARATLLQAHELALASAGTELPQLDLGSEIARQAIVVAPTGLTRAPIPVNVFAVGPTVSYQLDVFGAIKRQVEAEQALADTSEYQLAAAYLSLTGNVATQAITIAGLRAQIATVEQILDEDRQNLQLVNTAFAAGTASQVDVTTAEAQLANDRTLRPPLRQQLSVAMHALAVVVGKSPAEWSPPQFDLTALTLPADVPVSLPSQLVRQRPDILAAEAQLHEAGALVGVAIANQYPNLSITAAVGQQATQLSNFFSGLYNAWNVGLGLSAPIFHGGTLRARKRAAVAAFEAARDAYRETVIQAFGQVADQLEALTHDAEAVGTQRHAVDTAEQALRLARLSYQNGNSTLLVVLDNERAAQQAELGLVRAEAQRLSDTAELFVALGSGWWNTPANHPAPPVAPARPAKPASASAALPDRPRRGVVTAL
jgi:NodT family efflux transporter outer membrane factor (OMF) lipoprotein